jgi:hypothetical protein
LVVLVPWFTWDGRIFCIFFNLSERDYLEDPGVDRRIILIWIFRKWDVRVWTVLIWLRIGTVAGFCECGNEPSGSIKCGEFLE